MQVQTVNQKTGVANVDIVCVGGLTIKKGQRVHVALQFSKEWAHGGFRSVFNHGVAFTNADAFYDCIE